MRSRLCQRRRPTISAGCSNGLSVLIRPTLQCSCLARKTRAISPRAATWSITRTTPCQPRLFGYACMSVLQGQCPRCPLISANKNVKQVNRGLVQMATGMAGFMGIRLKLESVRLTAAALRDTVTAWAPLATAKERADLLARLEKARVANKDAGIDDAITFISTSIKGVK